MIKQQMLKPNFWKRFQAILMEQLKGALIKTALKKFIGSAAGGGFKVWLVKFIATELFEEVGEPLVKMALVEIRYVPVLIKGKLTSAKIIRAREDGNTQEYHATVNDMFGRKL